MRSPSSQSSKTASGSGRLVVASLCYDASLSLVLDGLSARVKRGISVLLPTSPEAVEAGLADAAAVLISRELQAPSLQYVADVCVARRIPYFYFLDDNFWVLSKEMPLYAWFNQDASRRFFENAAGIVTIVDRLAEYILTQGIHANVLRFTPVLDRALLDGQPAATHDNGTLTLAFAGSTQRNPAFGENVEPAIARLRQMGVSPRLIARRGGHFPLLAFQKVPVIEFPVEISFGRFVGAWRQCGPDILVHPRARTLNAPYKTPSIVLVACLLGAVPIVAAEPAFDGIPEGSGVAIVQDDSVSGWATAISDLRSAKDRQTAHRRLAEYCGKAFGPHVNERTIATMVSTGS